MNNRGRHQDRTGQGLPEKCAGLGARGSDHDRSPVKAREPKCPKSDCPRVSTEVGEGYNGVARNWSEKVELWKSRDQDKWLIRVTFPSFATPIGKAGSRFGLVRLAG